MKANNSNQCGHRYKSKSKLTLGLVLFAGLAIGMPVGAQDRDAVAGDRADNRSESVSASTTGPVRLARFSYLKGPVNWRADAQQEWAPASVNTPVQQGAQVEVPDGSRAEIQFDDGSVVRLGGGAAATLQTLYSDADGEFTEITLSDGAAWLALRNDRSIYQMNTPVVSVKSAGPSKLQVGAVDGAQIGVVEGKAALEGQQGKSSLQAGDYCDIRDENGRQELRAVPAANGWVRWNQGMDSVSEAATANSTRAGRMPANIALVSGNLAASGTWQKDSANGWVWHPRVTDPEWRPYHDGHWAMVAPFGWTWVSDESWGWAPYHYGAWVRVAGGWGWAPGPAVQCWSPAVVSFYECDGAIAWCPLAPAEVRYPTFIDAGYRRGDWTRRFSIGACGVYYPISGRICEAHPWRNHAVNGPHRAEDRNTYSMYRFVSANARAEGASMARLDRFGSHAKNEFVKGSAASFLARGHLIGAPASGHAPLAGPHVLAKLAQPEERSHLAHNSTEAALNRPVVRMPVDSGIARTGSPLRQAATTLAGAAHREVPQPSLGQMAAQQARGSLSSSSQPARLPVTATDPSPRSGLAGRDTLHHNEPQPTYSRSPSRQGSGPSQSTAVTTPNAASALKGAAPPARSTTPPPAKVKAKK